VWPFKNLTNPRPTECTFSLSLINTLNLLFYSVFSPKVEAKQLSTHSVVRNVSLLVQCFPRILSQPSVISKTCISMQAFLYCWPQEPFLRKYSSKQYFFKQIICKCMMHLIKNLSGEHSLMEEHANHFFLKFSEQTCFRITKKKQKKTLRRYSVLPISILDNVTFPAGIATFCPDCMFAIVFVSLMTVYTSHLWVFHCLVFYFY